MAELGVLTCPVCERHCVCGEDDIGERSELKNDARDHLANHDLPEGKRGIYGVMMVERMERRRVDVADGIETGTWRQSLPGALGGPRPGPSAGASGD